MSSMGELQLSRLCSCVGNQLTLSMLVVLPIVSFWHRIGLCDGAQSERD